jgi:DNA-binding CsgD family transcriptional regulator
MPFAMTERIYTFDGTEFRFAPIVDVLSERQLEVLMLLCLDHTRSGIAEALEIHIARVDQHLAAIKRKMDAKTVHGIVALAFRG